jgi:ABC-type enterobactin transport system permease subunit
MTRTARIWTLRLILAAVVLAAAFAPLLGPSAQAAVGGPHVCAYYSDATFTTVVGARGTGCCGETISWGITTPYKRCEALLCPAVVCPQ